MNLNICFFFEKIVHGEKNLLREQFKVFHKTFCILMKWAI